MRCCRRRLARSPQINPFLPTSFRFAKGKEELSLPPSSPFQFNLTNLSPYPSAEGLGDWGCSRQPREIQWNARRTGVQSIQFMQASPVPEE